MSYSNQLIAKLHVRSQYCQQSGNWKVQLWVVKFCQLKTRKLLEMTRNHVPKTSAVQVLLFGIKPMAPRTTPCSLHLLLFRKPKQIEGMSSLERAKCSKAVHSENLQTCCTTKTTHKDKPQKKLSK